MKLIGIITAVGEGPNRSIAIAAQEDGGANKLNAWLNDPACEFQLFDRIEIEIKHKPAKCGADIHIPGE